jgi:hypothetical protein
MQTLGIEPHPVTATGPSTLDSKRDPLRMAPLYRRARVMDEGGMRTAAE